MSKVKLIVLDACRNNPFAARMIQRQGRRSVGRGLAPVNATTGMLVAYSARAGTVADDGPAGGMSPFTQAFTRHVGAPETEVRLMLGRVRDDVVRATGRQEPFTYGSLGGEAIYLNPQRATPTPRPAPAAPAQAPAMPAPLSEAAMAWERVRQTTSIAVLEAFAKQFAGTVYAVEAQERIADLRRAVDERQREAVAPKQDEVRKPADAAPPPAVVHGAEKTKLYVVTFAPGGKLEGPPYTGGTIRRDYAGYAGTLVRDDRGTFEIKVTDVNVAGQGSLRHECTGGAALSAIKIGDIVRMKPGNCTMLTDYFVPGAAFEKAAAAVGAPPAAAADDVANLVPGSGQSARDRLADDQPCPFCPEMVVIPAGSFMMGSPDSEQGRDSDEGPQRRVTFRQPFSVGKFEVTFAEWDVCVSDGGCKHKPET